MRDALDDPLVTMTHARLRLLQGDAPGARKIVAAILGRRPGDAEAREMLASLESAAEVPHEEPDGESVGPPAAARPEELARAFRGILSVPRRVARSGRIERLAVWAEAVRRNRG